MFKGEIVEIITFITTWFIVFIIIHSILIYKREQVDNNISYRKNWMSKFIPNFLLYLMGLALLSLFGTLSISTWAIVTAIVALIKELLSKNTAKYTLDVDSKDYNKKGMHNLFLVILLAVVLFYISLSVIDELEVYAYQESNNLTVFFEQDYSEQFYNNFKKIGLLDNQTNKILTGLIRMLFVELEVICLAIVYFFTNHIFKRSFGDNIYSLYEKMMGSQTYNLNGYWHEIDTEGKITVKEIFYISSGKFYDRVDLSKKYTIVVNNGEISINKDGGDVLISIEKSKDNKKLKINDRYFINKDTSIYKECKKQGKILLDRIPLF